MGVGARPLRAKYGRLYRENRPKNPQISPIKPISSWKNGQNWLKFDTVHPYGHIKKRYVRIVKILIFCRVLGVRVLKILKNCHFLTFLTPQNG